MGTSREPPAVITTDLVLYRFRARSCDVGDYVTDPSCKSPPRQIIRVQEDYVEPGDVQPVGTTRLSGGDFEGPEDIGLSSFGGKIPDTL